MNYYKFVYTTSLCLFVGLFSYMATTKVITGQVLGLDTENFEQEKSAVEEQNEQAKKLQEQQKETSQKQIEQEKEQAKNQIETKSKQVIKTAEGTIEIQTEGNKQEINIESKNGHIEVKKEDNGKTKVNVEAASKSGKPEAMALKAMIMTALNKDGKTTYDLSVFDSSTSSESTKTIISLPGKTEKKFLGFLPMSFNKSIEISTENGQIVKTNQSIFSKIMEMFSF